MGGARRTTCSWSAFILSCMQIWAPVDSSIPINCKILISLYLHLLLFLLFSCFPLIYLLHHRVLVITVVQQAKGRQQKRRHRNVSRSHSFAAQAMLGMLHEWDSNAGCVCCCLTWSVLFIETSWYLILFHHLSPSSFLFYVCQYNWFRLLLIKLISFILDIVLWL